MYTHLSKEQLQVISDHGQVFLDLLIDNAHNTNPADEEPFLDFNQFDWDKIGLWEKHLIDSFKGMLNDIKYDLESNRVQCSCPDWDIDFGPGGICDGCGKPCR